VNLYDHAACTTDTTVDWFMQRKAGRYPDAEYEDNLKRARAICARCVVKPECLSLALEHAFSAGIWAGLTETEREDLPHARRRPREALCGTTGGYYRHLRTTGTEPCGACKAAHARAERRKPA
jgi:hypothetical protein